MTSKPTARDRFESLNNALEDHPEYVQFLISLVEAAMDDYANFVVHERSEDKQAALDQNWERIDQRLSQAEERNKETNVNKP